ncbi:MAG: Glu-tRNA(Gln) amidotransferase subunit GatE [Candidatus Cloacimonetes bacterium]|nr:Glu-tRNA(Gln) amidotransferase subunit GatE [Candidatus Cloacimonadota bacterium]
MQKEINADQNYQKTLIETGWVCFEEATAETYKHLGFKSGLEIHQQLQTREKLFCHCPTGIYQDFDDYDAEIVRHMRPTLSELGEYDGTALMEFKTRKEVIYRIKNRTACTYEVDDTPPFPLNRQALEIAIEISLLLKQYIVGEVHITRKQYLDGSIPTGFQRTAIIGIEGAIPLKNKPIRLIQLSLEEDSCREVSDIGHRRIYTTDRLGMPLIEMVTYPEMLTPAEVAEAAHYLRFLARSTGKVRTGIGAAREDVNVSITGGTRIEIKGVSHIREIPLLVHVEAFRQKALLTMREKLVAVISDPKSWQTRSCILDLDVKAVAYPFPESSQKLVAVLLPKFKGILSHFTQPGKDFSSELSDRLKVISCLEKPNLIHSEMANVEEFDHLAKLIKSRLKAEPGDAWICFAGPDEDIPTAIETIQERCQLAFEGVPRETRKSLADGNTLFERVLPGADRMYPDTDSAPIPVPEEDIEQIRNSLPVDLPFRLAQLKEWQVPQDCWTYLLRNNLMPVAEQIVNDFEVEPLFVCTLLAQNIKGRMRLKKKPFPFSKLVDIFAFLKDNNIKWELIKEMIPIIIDNPKIDFQSILNLLSWKKEISSDLFSAVPYFTKSVLKDCRIDCKTSAISWVMGKLRPRALGNVDMQEIFNAIEKQITTQEKKND